MKHVKTFSALMLMVMFTLAISITSCKKDDDGPTPDPIPPTGVTLRTHVTGKVTDTEGNLLPGVTVKLAGRTTITNARGIYLFWNIDVPKERMVVKAALQGYFNSVKGKKVQNEGVNYVDLVLQSLPSAVNIDAVSGGVVNLSGGAKITFQQNAFVDKNGVPYSGTVKVFARHINPAGNNFESVVPGGDLLGENVAGEDVALYSLGMIEVLLKDQTEINELKLATGKTAQLRFPIDPSQSSQAQISVPLWHLDPGSGIWKEEGSAVKNGNFFDGSVSHFSVWNCDYQGPRANIIGKVVDCAGFPVANLTVTINGFMNLITNNQGVYSTWVPVGYTITAQVLTSFNPTILTNSNAPSIVAVAGPSNVIPDLVVNCLTRISGTVLSCGTQQNAVAFVYASWNGGFNYQLVTNGTYSVSVPPQTYVNVIASGFSSEGSLHILSGSDGSNTNVAPIEICDIPGVYKTGFKLTGNGIDQYYDLDVDGVVSDFIDANNDGEVEEIQAFISGIAQPGDVPVTIIQNISMSMITNGFIYSLTTPGNGGDLSIFMNFQSGQVILHSGYGAPTTNSNTIQILEFGSLGGNFSGKFEYDNIGGYAITEGTFSIRREN
jgi:hypothetical protein